MLSRRGGSLLRRNPVLHAYILLDCRKGGVSTGRGRGLLGGRGGDLERRLGVGDNGAVGRDELDRELRLPVRAIRQDQAKVADLIGPQVPLRVPIGAAIGENLATRPDAW